MKLKQEIRHCKCGCGYLKEVKINSKWKYKSGHNSNKGRKKLHRESRVCICGCNETFECKVNSKRKYSKSSHTSKMHNIDICNCCFCEAKRGKHIPWNKGKTIKDDNRILSGKKHPRFGMKGELHPSYGRTYINLKITGKNNPNYKDGNSIGKRRYPKEFSDYIKKEVRNRDNYICQLCGIKEENYKKIIKDNLSVHHIDYCKNNNEKNNLITLCQPCNKKVERNKKYWGKYFTDKIKKKGKDVL